MSRDDKVWMIRAAALQGIAANCFHSTDEGPISEYAARLADTFLAECDRRDKAARVKDGPA